MPFTQVRDLNLYYELRGEGPNLLFIGGSGGDLREKPNIFDSPLTESFTILAYDQRGLGRTATPDAPYTMADYAEDAIALLDAIGWRSCHVMGASFGGMVGQELAIRFPERIERLVLACTSSGGRGGSSYPLHELLELDPRERARRNLSLHDTRHDQEWQASHSEKVAEILDHAVAEADALAREPGRELGARRQLEARIYHDTYDRLPAVTLPVYICGGKYDGIAPVENLVALERQLPNARLELFEGGHLFLAQDMRVYPRLLAFLQGDLDTEP